MSNFEKIFYQDVRDKKRTASGIHHRASRKGYVRGGIKTQSDFMTKKEKDKLNGEVKVYNMFDKYNVIENVPSLNEIERMDLNERVSLYRFLKNKYSNSVLQKHWNISSGSLYNKVYEKYNLYIPRVVKTAARDKDTIYNNNINNVPSLEEILEMPTNQAKGILIAVKEEFTILSILNHWNISKGTLYKYYRQFKISSKQDLNNVTKKNKDIKNIEECQNKNEQEQLNEKTDNDSNINNSKESFTIEQLIDMINSINMSNKMSSKGFNIQVNGEYSKESLQNKLNSISNILEENSKYKITLSIEEI